MAKKKPQSRPPTKKPKAELLPKGYQAFLGELKERIRTAQLRASLAVNRELVLNYWQTGRDILARQQEHGWGAKVIDRLSQDLRREFPGVEGFSPRNLKYMRAFAQAWSDEPIVQEVLAQITWCHNLPAAGESEESPSATLVRPQDRRKRLEPKRPRPLDRERPLRASREGPDEFPANTT